MSGFEDIKLRMDLCSRIKQFRVLYLASDVEENDSGK